MVTSRLWLRTKSRPARIGGPERRSCATLGVSFTGTPRRIVEETSNSSASASSASGAPVSLINAPAAAGPVTSAVEEASAFFACASTRRSRGTIWVSTICAALPAVVFTAPITKPTRYSQSIDSQPSHHAKRHGRHGERDRHLADDVHRQLAHPIEPHARRQGEQRERHDLRGGQRPICVGEACSSTAADSGSASSVTWPPNEEMRMEVHKRRYVAIAQQIGGTELERLEPPKWREGTHCVETLTPRSTAAGC